MTESALGCAQNADGSLRDAKDIDFFEDRDDEHPISGPTASSSKVHPFFTGSAKPVGKVAGSRRSARKPQPSNRLTDPNNAESSVSVGKRKASSPAASRQSKQPRLPASDSEDAAESGEDSDGGEAEVGGDTEGEDGQPQEVMDVEEYRSIKAMADADHAQVCARRIDSIYSHFPQAVAKVAGPDSTADVRTVFTRVKDHNNPTSGVVESGSLCKICVYVCKFFQGAVI